MKKKERKKGKGNFIVVSFFCFTSKQSVGNNVWIASDINADSILLQSSLLNRIILLSSPSSFLSKEIINSYQYTITFYNILSISYLLLSITDYIIITNTTASALLPPHLPLSLPFSWWYSTCFGNICWNSLYFFFILY